MAVGFACDGHGDGVWCFIVGPSAGWGADFFKNEGVGSWFGEFEGMPCYGFCFSVGEVSDGFCCPRVGGVDEVGPPAGVCRVVAGATVPPSCQCYPYGLVVDEDSNATDDAAECAF